MLTFWDAMRLNKSILILFAAVASALLFTLAGCVSAMNPRVSKAALHDYPGAYQYYIDNMDQYDVFVCNPNRHTAIVMDKKGDKYAFKPQGEQWYRVTDKDDLGAVYVWMTDKYRMDKQAQAHHHAACLGRGQRGGVHPVRAHFLPEHASGPGCAA